MKRYFCKITCTINSALMKLFLCSSMFLMFLGIQATALAQGITQVRAEVDKVNRRIYVYYDLLIKKGKHDKYEVDLYLSQDSGKTFIDRLELVGGNVGKGVIPGVNKKIEWYYTKELPQFDGSNTAFKVRAKVDMQARKERILALQGPTAVGYSLLFPGWGDYKVRSGNTYWLVGFSAYAIAGTGLYLRGQSNRNFDAYLSANDIEQADSFFKKAQNQKRLSNTLFVTAASIWVMDMVLVAWQGMQNRKEQQRIQPGAFGVHPLLRYNAIANAPEIGIVLQW